MRKHEYVLVGEAVLTVVEGDTAFTFFKFQCLHCGHVTLLDSWQLKEMPRSMAKCPTSPVRSTLREWLSGAYNCLAKGAVSSE